MLGANCSANNKIPETDTGVQPEDQNSKTATGSYLYLRLKVGDPASTNPQIETENETCLLLPYILL